MRREGGGGGEAHYRDIGAIKCVPMSSNNKYTAQK